MEILRFAGASYDNSAHRARYCIMRTRPMLPRKKRIPHKSQNPLSSSRFSERTRCKRGVIGEIQEDKSKSSSFFSSFFYLDQLASRIFRTNCSRTIEFPPDFHQSQIASPRLVRTLTKSNAAATLAAAKA